jgi:two-component system NarL family sensor kinase
MIKLPIKLLLLATTPVVIALVLTYVFITNESRHLSEQTLSTLETFLMESKRRELHNYSQLANSAINHIYKSADPDNHVAQSLVADILEEMSYNGDDGYFFVYDDKGNSIAHSKQPFRVGQNWWDLEDKSGSKIIQILIENAKNGGDYYQYPWDKPSLHSHTEKVSYSWYLPKWNWMIGTGIYLDDVEAQIAALQKDIDRHIKNTEEIILGIALTTAFTIFLIALIIALKEKTKSNTQLNLLSQRIVNLQEEERRRISREMHDGIVQILVSIKYSIEATRMFLNKNNDITPEPLHHAATNLNSAIQEIRRISHDLHPRILDELGLGLALDSLTNEFSRRTGISVDLVRPAVKKVLPDDIATTLYRVVQESLTNIERHSQAKFCKVNLYFTSQELVLEIVDDGTGFDEGRTPLSDGIGIRNLTERLDYQGGAFEVISTPQGTTVVAKISNSLFKGYSAPDIDKTACAA